MSRRNLNFTDNTFYHVYNRGVSKIRIFDSDCDVYRFIRKIKHYLPRFNVHICTYSIMRNHFHFLVSGKDISDFFRVLQLSHSVYFNIKYKHFGHVFESKFKAKPTTKEDYFLEVQKYIQNNPLELKFTYSEAGVSGRSVLPT